LNRARTDTPRQGKARNHNQKRSPELMRRWLTILMEWPNKRRASEMCGISLHLHDYWKKQSERGPAGGEFAVTLGEGEEAVTKEFHEWIDECVDVGADRVEEEYQDKALGYWEDVIYEGRRCYEVDPKKPWKVVKGKVVPNHLKDKDGNLVPLRVWKKSETAQHNLLKAYKPGRYRENATIDMNMKGGSFLVPAQALNEAEFEAEVAALNEAGRKAVAKGK